MRWRGAVPVVAAAALAVATSPPAWQLAKGNFRTYGHGSTTISGPTNGGRGSGSSGVVAPPPQLCGPGGHATATVTEVLANRKWGPPGDPATFATYRLVCQETTNWQYAAHARLTTSETNSILTQNAWAACNAIDASGYWFSYPVQIDDLPYRLWWRQFVRDANDGECITYFSYETGSAPPPSVTKIQWQWDVGSTFNLSAPSPTWGTWSPPPLMLQGIRARGYVGPTPTFETYPAPSFVDAGKMPAPYDAMVAAQPIPHNIALTIDPTESASTVTSTTSAQGSVQVTVTLSNGVTKTVSVPGLTIDASVSAKLGGFTIFSLYAGNQNGTPIITPGTPTFCTPAETAASAQIFQAVPAAWTAWREGLNEAPELAWLGDGPFYLVSNPTDAQGYACTVQLDARAGYGPGPAGDWPIEATAEYVPTGGTITISIPPVVVDGVRVPNTGSTCTVDLGPNGASGGPGDWCQYSAQLSSFASPPSQPLYVHSASFIVVTGLGV